MHKHLKKITEALTPDEARSLARTDALRADLTIEMAGVDITKLPRLPPELQPEKARWPAEPPGKPPAQRQRRRRG